ncbi:MAG: GNAT family N-acetyltransferase [Pyrinomonadaceae bacterium]
MMLESERLILRRFTNKDIDALFAHRSDSEVMVHLGGVQKRNMVVARVETYNNYFDAHGYAMCAMIWKKTGEFIGVGGLQQLFDDGEVEVGYTLEKEFWGRGIATECTLACLHFGFTKAALETIGAQTSSRNMVSLRVLEKCGFTIEGETVQFGEKWFRLKITKQTWKRRV